MGIQYSQITDTINAFGPMVAAAIAVYGGKRISNKFIENEIHTYNDREYDAGRIMKRAKESIYIIANIGDQLWEKHKKDFARYIDSGVYINWLISSKTYYSQINGFIGCNIAEKKREDIINEMRMMQSVEGKGRFILREFEGPITSSYIAVDIDAVRYKEKSNFSVIHYMPYCYHLDTSKSPIVDVYPDRDKKIYGELKSSIEAMWEVGTSVE